MANYKEAALTGTKWVRSPRVTVSNPYGGAPSVCFEEEEITLLSDGRTNNAQYGQVGAMMTDPATEIPLIHPETGASLGTGTHGQLHVLLYSLYMALVAERDNAPEPDPEP